MNDCALNLFIGKPKKLYDTDFISSIQKNKVEKITLLKDKIIGDEVANKKYHGGIKRVLHHYSIENYNQLKELFPEIQDRFIPGSYGENITSKNLNEKNVCAGDIYKIGTCLVQLTIPRSPCKTIDLNYQTDGVLKAIIQTRIYGWFYKVLEEGEIHVGDEIILKDRLFENCSIENIISQGMNKKNIIKKSELKSLLKEDVLDQKWKRKLER